LKVPGKKPSDQRKREERIGPIRRPLPRRELENQDGKEPKFPVLYGSKLFLKPIAP